MAAQESGKSAGVRRFLGIRQRPSGRWVAEIKDSVQRVRLSLRTFDTVEDAACACHKAARRTGAARGQHAHQLRCTARRRSQAE
ncbi:Ethylene-responsive transcription factor RAP2-11 [Triticum urartu]|uniref:Ethylene-responsive transcription factor RAP2-11 n=1 Tax=Triticum urartu TaxID=4572 RepID=M8B5D0_TRIUA|nr:Ethylene-responsive transcription factor RAP2-11 [Triticum urartu]